LVGSLFATDVTEGELEEDDAGPEADDDAFVNELPPPGAAVLGSPVP
jgi:hypothetical protein